MTENGIGQIAAGIVLGARTDEEAEAAFAARLEELVELPAQVEVAGHSVILEEIESTPGRRRVRGVVGDGRWRVALDSLEFEAGSAAAELIRAYRHWLGYEVGGESGPAVQGVISTAHTEGRVRDLEEAVDQALTVLEGLDMGELESWLGADDPWGYEEQYWPQAMQVFKEKLKELDGLVGGTSELVDAGFVREGRALLEVALFGLEGLCFDYFCPDDVQSTAADAVKYWLKTFEEIDGGDSGGQAVAEQFGIWIECFELVWWLDRIVEDAPGALHLPLIHSIEERLRSDDASELRTSIWTRALRRLRKGRGELELMAERLPSGKLSCDDVLALMELWQERGELERAVEFAEKWCAAVPSRSARDTESVREERRSIMQVLNRGQEAFDELWLDFTTNPTPEKLAELRQLSPEEDHDRLDERALEFVGDDPYRLLGFAVKLEPFAPLVERIAELEVNQLKKVSSWSLKDAAPRLADQWPETAVRIYVALGWRHVNRGKPKYYHLSLEAFEKARDLYRALGKAEKWEELVNEVSEEHGRKYTFMPGFRRLSEE